MSSALLLADAAELARKRPYIERFEAEGRWHDQAADWLLATWSGTAPRRWLGSRRLGNILDLVAPHEAAMRTASDGGLRGSAARLRQQIRHQGLQDALVGECFALLREVAARSVGQRPYDCQLMAGWALLQGRLVEMATGEGKTLTAILPACTMGLAGIPAHVITVNDYLAERDAQSMAPVYEFLGLKVGSVVQGMPPDARRAAYAQAVTYCSNKELAFDYLRDRVALQQRSGRTHLALERLAGMAPRDERLVLRGLWFGLVDEADSVLIDEARTPLILSATSPAGDDAADCGDALDLARELHIGADYRVALAERRITLTENGLDRLEAFRDGRGGIWSSQRGAEELLNQALSALLLFHRDEHYVVSDGKVQIVDESTGRVMPDRAWERGLHQLIEVKEGCEPTGRRQTLARMTYQRLFRRYLRLSGMTGTAREVAPEIAHVYRLGVVSVPLNRPSRRIDLGTRVCATQADKWEAVADRVVAVSGDGRPVLVGTRSVNASEMLSAVLSRRGVAHALLNAKQDREEAEVVALAGEAGRVTVATNMAGRGTDIKLASAVAERGGLHVILTEFHESSRVDRQLFGRCGRQGDPGSCETIVSLQDEVFQVHASVLTQLATRLAARRGNCPPWAVRALRHWAQGAAQRKAVAVRAQTLERDRRLERLLAFSGCAE